LHSSVHYVVISEKTALDSLTGKLKYTEIVISDVNSDNAEDWVLLDSWRPADIQDARILDQLIETVRDKVIREEI
jgi:hypothetical protein